MAADLDCDPSWILAAHVLVLQKELGAMRARVEMLEAAALDQELKQKAHRNEFDVIAAAVGDLLRRLAPIEIPNGIFQRRRYVDDDGRVQTVGKRAA